MKDNFQDRVKGMVGMFYDTVGEYTDGKLYDSDEYKNLENSLTQLLKDYIEAQMPELHKCDNECYDRSNPWKTAHNESTTGYYEALQQYKSNLLEGLSDG